ncbi:ATP-binding protein [Streptomyces sp. NPDC058955]|uniref:ATP-binding protein n=1 Tax=unclassified Streptomyces TaxID=2593676 RepID=UPI0036461010
MAEGERSRPGAVRSRRYALGGGPGLAGRLRDLSEQAVTDWYGPFSPAARTAADDVLLLVTELVAHAVRRGEAPYELCLDRSVDGVWLQVSDSAPGRPLTQDRHRSGRPCGQCLYLVQRLAAAWGSVPRGRGRTVWCEVPFPLDSPAAAV